MTITIITPKVVKVLNNPSVASYFSFSKFISKSDNLLICSDLIPIDIISAQSGNDENPAVAYSTNATSAS
jgi:hypothetical protein